MRTWAAVLAAGIAFLVAGWRMLMPGGDCPAWTAIVIGASLLILATFLFWREQLEGWQKEADAFRRVLLRFTKYLGRNDGDKASRLMLAAGTSIMGVGLKWATVDLDKPPADWLPVLYAGAADEQQQKLLKDMESIYADRDGVLGNGSSLGDDFWEFHAARQELNIQTRLWGDRLRGWGLFQPFWRFRRWIKKEVLQYERPLIVLQYAEIVLAFKFRPPKRPPGDRGPWALFKRLQEMK